MSLALHPSGSPEAMGPSSTASRPDPPGPSRRRAALPSLLLVPLFVLFGQSALAQETPLEVLPADTTAADTMAVDATVADTAAADPAAAQPPALGQATAPSGSDLKEPVRFSAADSLVIVLGSDGGDRGSLFGTANVSYTDAALDAYRIDILFEEDELRATGLRSDTGLVGRPSFKQASESFSGRELAFNLRTERGRVVAARTAIQDGFIEAGVVKVGQDSTLYVADGIYTTCECPPEETPSYSLRSTKMKIVDGEWIYTGPIQLFLFNIPTPLWLPFGFLPAREGRRSGPLPPSYGEDERGFYLRGWGWYQAINDYMDLQVQFGLWTRGSWEISPLYRYNKRYAYSGNLALSYIHNRRGERDDPDFRAFNTSSLRWTHNQTLSPTASFNGNVNLSSQNYLRTASEQYEDLVRSTIQSSVQLSKRWPAGGRSLNLNVSHRQALATGATDVSLPSLSFSQASRKPFKRDATTSGRERWYEKLTYTYSGAVDNQYRFDPLPADTLIARGDPGAADIGWYEALVSPSAFERATGGDLPFEFRASHRLSSSAAFAMNRLPVVDRVFRVNVAPSINYTEDWFIQTREMAYDEEARRVVTDSRADWLALRQFATSLSANTTFYGLFPLRVGPFYGLRHVVRPTVGFTYRPDFYAPGWGYTDTYVDREGNEVRYALVNGVTRGLQKSLSLGLSNEFLTKRLRADTAATARTDRPLQLLNLDLSSSYNFAADSLKLAPISLSARTRIADQFSIQANAALSAYDMATLTDGRRFEIDRYLFRQPGRQFARLTRFSLSATTSLQSQNRGGGRPTGLSRAQFREEPSVFGEPATATLGDPYDVGYGVPGQDYVDFAIPWKLNLDVNYSYQPLSVAARQRATINAAFDFNVTPNWKVRGRSGYDFVNAEAVLTEISVFRDFECWEMSFNWRPFGPYQSYSFDLHVKSGHLRDILRLRQPRSDVRGRFGRATM